VTIGRIPPRAPAAVRRLAETVAALPSVAGRLALGEAWPPEANYSGAAFVSASWDGRPALLKLGANRREVEWAELLSGETDDLVPQVYATGHGLGSGALSWVVMERCPLLLDYGWGDALFDTVLDAAVRFQVAARRLAPAAGPADVDTAQERVVAFFRQGDAAAALPSGGTRRLFERFEEQWAWALEACQVELCHGDLHPANAVWRVPATEPGARALLIDPAPRPLPWVYEPAYCQTLYWTAGCRADEPGLVHRMADVRRARGLEVPEASVVDRLATLFLAWHGLRFWDLLAARRSDPRWAADIRRWVDAAAALPLQG
jgi:hypothetical protein